MGSTLVPPNEAVEKVPEKTYGADRGYVDHSGTAVSGMHAILRGQILHTNSGNFKIGFFYSFNVEFTGLRGFSRRPVE